MGVGSLHMCVMEGHHTAADMLTLSQVFLLFVHTGPFFLGIFHVYLMNTHLHLLPDRKFLVYMPPTGATDRKSVV